MGVRLPLLARENHMNVVVAMSGGVDSTVAAALLIRQGHGVIGVTMRLWDGMGPAPPRRCCSPEEIEEAARAAAFLGISHRILDFREQFFEKVVRRFCNDYLDGITPNPCVVCNEVIKAGLLLDYARSEGSDVVATGHYARIATKEHGARLFRGADQKKDQSYFLHRIAPQRLCHMMFPLGELTKSGVRAIARDLALPVASKPESQEICFVPTTGYTGIVERFGIGTPQRGIVAYQGKVLYRHDGIHRFTVGQRCGGKWGPGHRVYVKSIDPVTGRIEADRRAGLYFTAMTVRDIIWHLPVLPPSFEAEVKIRYHTAPVPASIEVIGENKVLVRFSRPQFAVAPGQAAVFYGDDVVIGGGWIERGEHYEK